MSMIIMLVLNITASMLITYPSFYFIHSQKLQHQITQICHPIIIYAQIKEIIKYEGWLCGDFENCRLLFVAHELTILTCWRFQYSNLLIRVKVDNTGWSRKSISKQICWQNVLARLLLCGQRLHLLAKHASQTAVVWTAPTSAGKTC